MFDLAGTAAKLSRRLRWRSKLAAKQETSRTKIAKFRAKKENTLHGCARLNEGEGIPDFPVALYLEVSNICNFKCAFCASFSAINPNRFNSLKAIDRGFFELNDVGDGLDELVANALIVYLFGFGEPTIHPQFVDLIRYVGSRETQVEFVTNGLMLDKELARTVVDERVRQVTFSFSGASKAEYESMYLGGDFDEVTRNIRTLADLKKEACSPYPIININSIGFVHQISALPQFMDLMGQCGVNIVNINALIVQSTFPEMYHHAEVFDESRHRPAFDEAKRIAEKYGIIIGAESFLRQNVKTAAERESVLRSRTSGTISGPVPVVPLFELPQYAKTVKPLPPTAEKISVVAATSKSEAVSQLDIKSVPDTDPLYCMEPFRTAYLKRSGHVAPCCLWPNTTQSFGNIRTWSARDVWNSPAFGLTRAAMLRQEFPSGCEFCVKSRAAPEDPQLYQAAQFAEWYYTCYGEDLRALAPSRLNSAQDIYAKLRL